MLPKARLIAQAGGRSAENDKNFSCSHTGARERGEKTGLEERCSLTSYIQLQGVKPAESIKKSSYCLEYILHSYTEWKPS